MLTRTRWFFPLICASALATPMLFLALPLGATPMFTNSATATIPCLENGTVTTHTFSGSSISGGCPDGELGPTFAASAAVLGVSGQLRDLFIQFGPTVTASYNAQSSMQDTIAESGGEQEIFTIVLRSSLFGDATPVNVDADLLVNGSTVWSAHRVGANDPFNIIAPWNRTETFIVDVPISSPLSIQADISTSVSAAMSVNYEEFSSGSLSVFEVQTPETATFWLLLVGLTGLNLWAWRRKI